MGSEYRHGRQGPVVSLLLFAALLYPLGCTSGCSSSVNTDALQSANAPRIRVRLLSAVDSVTLSCGVPPLYQLSNQPAAQLLNSPNNAVFTLSLDKQGWQAGNASLGGANAQGVPSAILHVQPDHDGSVSINNVAYRGRFRFVPVGGNKFDVINEVDVDSYLASVVSKEMLPNWHEEAYKAQAVVARTYAIYEKQTAGADRYWDVYPDTRSQVYGGIPAETARSRAAVAQTAGIVVAAPDANGYPRIFKAYFSSCCGGISQSAADAFGDPYIPPLTEQDVHAACRASPRFNWGPVVIDKSELTRRFVAYGQRRNRAEQHMATIARIDVQAENRWGRPVRFLVTDVKGSKFSLSGEDFRWAVNFGAPENSNTILWSSFVKVISDSDKIRFVEGHGWGHGAGLCQWCAEKRAEDGMHHEDIVLAAYPTATLVRAY
ncbi:MAG TPA: SpoIID/LytB domain-containing protein [Tepidisphaeraceae bacterium]|jgi:stage II sporulation protein D